MKQYFKGIHFNQSFFKMDSFVYVNTIVCYLLWNKPPVLYAIYGDVARTEYHEESDTIALLIKNNL